MLDGTIVEDNICEIGGFVGVVEIRLEVIFVVVVVVVGKLLLLDEVVCLIN